MRTSGESKKPESASVRSGSETAAYPSVYTTLSHPTRSDHPSRYSHWTTEIPHDSPRNTDYHQSLEIGLRESTVLSYAEGVLSGAASLGIEIPAQIQEVLLNKHGSVSTVMHLNVAGKGCLSDGDVILHSAEVWPVTGQGGYMPIGYDFRAGDVEADLMGIGTQFGRN